MKFEIRRSGAEFFWRLVASNGKTLAHSERYKNRGDAESAITTIITGAADAEIHDLTSKSSTRDDVALTTKKSRGSTTA